MKQLDLILSIVAIVVGLVVAFVIVGTRKPPGVAPTAPHIETAPVALPEVQIPMANGLPGGSKGPASNGGRRGKGGGGVLG